MRRRILGAAAAVAACAALISAPALAIENPLAATIMPVGGNQGAHGNVTFFQMGSSVNVAVSLDKDTAGEAAIDLRKGTCKNYSQSSRWPLGTFGGSSDETKLPNTKLQSLVGQVLLIHKSQNVDSPAIGCAEIRG